MTSDAREPCRHEIGRRAIGGFPGHECVHPAGPQLCLLCGKTLEELFEEARAEARKDGSR
jgi:hypothetical protein